MVYLIVCLDCITLAIQLLAVYLLLIPYCLKYHTIRAYIDV